MSQLIEIKVPDIGDFDAVPVIELFVKAGDRIAVDDAICTLESDKATMDVPSTAAGTVREVLVAIGDKVGEGSVLIKLEADTAQAAAAPAAAAPAPAAAAATTAAPTPAAPTTAAAGGVVEVKVPDIGDFDAVPVIELFVKAGDRIAVDDAICTLESDKATMDVPSTAAGTIREVLVAIGDKVGEGTVLIKVEGSADTAASAPPAAATVVAPEAPAPAPAPSAAAPVPAAAPAAAAPGAPSAVTLGGRIHASPSVRVHARELGVDLAQVKGSGPKGRILKSDVNAFVKSAMTSGAAAGRGSAATLGGGLDLLPWPKVDFAKFGDIEVKPLSRIRKISAQNLARNWVVIPAVTYHEDADITELEAFRVQMNKEHEKAGKKLTMLAFIIKASVRALQEFPDLNTSLEIAGDEMNLVYKKYYNIAFAADTPNGLVVPVVKNADRKSVFEIAAETSALAKKARDGKLGPADMSGACFTISSLGGIGGTYFSPIVNAPEVAILGVNKSVMKPVWDGKAFVPRLILPMSLTADHRVIDGALATRFNVYLAKLLADFRRVML